MSTSRTVRVIVMSVVTAVLAGAFPAADVSAQGVNTPLPFMPPDEVTTSGQGVILAGETRTTVTLGRPTCDDDFLVTAVHVGPVVDKGATATDVVNLPNWAVSVSMSQLAADSSRPSPLTLLGQGPEHLSATLPAGQKAFGSTSVDVLILMLGGAPATHRFEFNVHVTGRCGSAFVAP